jgi:hypothetical protein
MKASSNAASQMKQHAVYAADSTAECTNKCDQHMKQAQSFDELKYRDSKVRFSLALLGLAAYVIYGTANCTDNAHVRSSDGSSGAWYCPHC